MKFKPESYFLEKSLETPILILELPRIRSKWADFKNLFGSFSDIFYAVKACPDPEVLRFLIGAGSNFDLASVGELDLVLSLGADPRKCSFGNTIKKERDIEYFYSKGVRLFSTDSFSDVEKLARKAPGADIFCRILVDAKSAEWPLSKKFGCDGSIASAVLIEAKTLGLNPVGVSFHPGSQQTDLTAWDEAFDSVREIFQELEKEGVTLSLVNVGGGYPGTYQKTTPDLQSYASNIRANLRKLPRGTRAMIEPGRGLVADAGTLISEVVMVSDKGDKGLPWCFVDIGKFGGLAETLDESIKYRLEFFNKHGEALGRTRKAILAGPTCDSADILYEKNPVTIPELLESGSYLSIRSTGAYTTSYSSVGFNGFKPLEVKVVDYE